jgi:hypothetical protein
VVDENCKRQFFILPLVLVMTAKFKWHSCFAWGGESGSSTREFVSWSLDLCASVFLCPLSLLLLKINALPPYDKHSAVQLQPHKETEAPSEEEGCLNHSTSDICYINSLLNQ